MKTQNNISKMLSGLACWCKVDEFAIVEYHRIGYLNPSFAICGKTKNDDTDGKCCVIIRFPWADRNVKKPIEPSNFVLHSIDNLASIAKISQCTIKAKIVSTMLDTLKKDNLAPYFVDDIHGNYMGESNRMISKINNIDEFKIWCDLNT